MAAALQFLQEHKLTDCGQLAARTEAVADCFHHLGEEVQQTEAALSKTTQLMAADYAKTRHVFDSYKVARYSKKYLSERNASFATHRGTAAAMRDLPGGAKLSRMENMKISRREPAEKHKALYADYRDAQRKIQETAAVKTNIDHLRAGNNAQEH